MKHTAVEWLEKEMNASDWWYLSQSMKQDIINQAKEMEKEQIMSAFMQGDIFGADYYDGVNPTDENYYNQTFKSE